MQTFGAFRTLPRFSTSLFFEIFPDNFIPMVFVQPQQALLLLTIARTGSFQIYHNNNLDPPKH
jgi:hypothetical protein